MFERYLTDALATHFGHLVENVDAEKVRLSAWNGKLVLEDVYLRTDALDNLVDKCPVEMVYGRVGKLDVQVPWSLVGAQLWKKKTTKETPADDKENVTESSGVCVVLSDVNILITPKRSNDPKRSDSNGELPENAENDTSNEDDKALKQIERERKEKAVLDLIDAQLLSRLAMSTSQTSSRWKWVQDWLSSLLSNLRVTIRNIHIRYEDPGSCMGFVWNISSSSRPRRYRKSFSVGVTLGEFSVRTISGEDEVASDNVDATVDSADPSCKVPCDDTATDASSVDTQNSEPEQQQQQSKPYYVRRKMAAAEDLAIYWDSGGCCLISQSAPLEEAKERHLLERAYIDAAFSSLNAVRTDAILPDEEPFKIPHSYLLDPVSPSVKFSLVDEKDIAPQSQSNDTVTNDKPSTVNTSVPAIHAIPPSSIKLTLPPTLFSISRQTLGDTVYLRKSLSVWAHSKKGLLSEATLKRLAKLRPQTSPTESPRAWWKYACEVTVAFIRMGQQGHEPRGKDQGGMSSERQLQPIRRRCNWLSVSRALKRRKIYVELYRRLFSKQDVFEDVDGTLSTFLEQTHNALLEMEDGLAAQEICAFRIASYYAMTADQTVEFAALRLPQEEVSQKHVSKSRWQGLWSKAPENAENRPFPRSSKMGTSRLSLEHRFQTFIELVQALEREKMNTEIGEKEKEGEKLSLLRGSGHSGDSEEDQSPRAWELSLTCPELSLQVNDQRVRTSLRRATRRSSMTSKSVPVVRLSCACAMESVLYFNGSWGMEFSVAALVMKDLTRGSETADGDNSSLPYSRDLIGPKFLGNCEDDAILVLDGISYRRSVNISVNRKLKSYHPEAGLDHAVPKMGTTTNTQVRVYPMEVIYSTVPVESLSRILATAKTPELTDDYHRMAGRVHEWREKQKKRLLQALAHKEKEIFVDVDVTAPVLLIPESFSRADSPMLLLDLGQLQFSNETSDEFYVPEHPLPPENNFDDAWLLILKNIQVQCSTLELYRKSPRIDDHDSMQHPKGPRQVVEPFSLDFSILTKVTAEGDQARTKVTATLPRLSFDFTSSAVRLMNRLQSQWAERKDEVKINAFTDMGDSPDARRLSVVESSDRAHERHETSTFGAGGISSPLRPGQKPPAADRIFEFHFSAPIITLRLENDVDELASPSAHRLQKKHWNSNSQCHLSTPLINLAIRGIGGSFVQKDESSGITSKSFDARLHSLDAVDLYQTAGIDYALLLSSLHPQKVLGQATFEDGMSLTDLFSKKQAAINTSETDLVLVKYSTRSGPDYSSERVRSSDSIGHKLSIAFHELYVEWNPETLAAIHKAIKIPMVTPTVGNDLPTDSSELQEYLNADEEFFDAEEGEDEEEFFDTLSDAGNDKLELGTSFGFTNPISTLEESPLWNYAFRKENSFHGLQSSMLATDFAATHGRYDNLADENSQVPFEVEFNLSKLRVNLNKESRHRRLLTAEMDRTSIKYETTATGGSKTLAQLGNLIFSDPACTQGHTLYGDILGLQTDATASSSLLEMEIVINPKTRRTIGQSTAERMEQNVESVSICYENGSVFGCDTFVRAKFSPMRFVYLQQLWSEVADYVFDGVMGYEVWGKERPTSSTPSLEDDASHLRESSDPFKVSFTRFDISMDSPVVLFPVTYRSPHFVRLNSERIAVSNYFRFSGDAGPTDAIMWYNNCDISFTALRIFSWNGTELSHAKQSVGADISVRWPIGPLAPLEVPKWNVTCGLGSLHLSLLKEDYALFQNIISYNVGELSRNLDEWEALQNLTTEELTQYRNSVMVDFGYDKKDSAPTTYNVALSIPVFSISLNANSGSTVATVKCSSLNWEMQKQGDQISRQKVTCGVDLMHPTRDGQVEMLLTCVNGDTDSTGLEAGLPKLTYTSTSKPSGDNIKTLDIADGCIYMVYPAWKVMSGFFTELPEAEILSVEEVALSVQVGDRWYRVGSSPHNGGAANMSTNKSSRRFSWIQNSVDSIAASEKLLDSTESSFQLRVTLVSPCIILSSSSDKRVVLRLRHLDFLYTNDGSQGVISRSFFLDNLELYTSSRHEANHDFYSEESSLIHPWCVAGVTSSCNGKQPCQCDSHSLRITADILKARAAFSDMIVSIDVCLRLLSDIRQSRAKDRQQVITSSRSWGSEKVNNDCDISEREYPSSAFVDEPKTEITALDWKGFELLVIDDSGRHFVGPQELITLVLGRIMFSRLENNTGQNSVHQENCRSRGNTSEMTLRLTSVELFDCLQVEASPFRLLATSRTGSFDGQCTVLGSPEEPMKWEDFTAIQSGGWGFSPSRAHKDRMPGVDITARNSELSKQEELDSILLRRFCDGLSHNYTAKLNSFSLQWSPSTVIAMQRFMGRLKKTAVKSLDGFHEDIADLMTSTDANVPVENAPNASEKVKAVLDIEAITLCLNKEHQNRRLLQVSVSGAHVNLESHEIGSTISGSVKDIVAWDCDNRSAAPESPDDVSPNNCVFRVTGLGETMGKTYRSFLDFRYSTFNKQNAAAHGEYEVPAWVLSHLSSGNDGDIDDYLEVSVATIELIYLRERSEEILDYLSNGLPGKGMGKFSQSAQGFLKKRIRTKSFLQVQVEAPTLLIPSGDFDASGITCRLGDMNLNSWFEGGTSEGRLDTIQLDKDISTIVMSRPAQDRPEQTEWWRMLSLRISNFSAGTFERASSDSSMRVSAINKPLDLSLILQKPAWQNRALSLRCKLTLADMSLKYSQYCLINAVIQGNIGKKIDPTKWDNMEKQYEIEQNQQIDDQAATDTVIPEPKRVEYASGARRIRYGTKSKGSSSSYAGPVDTNVAESPAMNVKFMFDGFTMKLTRDDPLVETGKDDASTGFDYDMVLLRVQVVEVTIVSKATTDLSLHLSLYRIGLFDLGDHGRLDRENFLLTTQSVKTRKHLRETRLPCAFSVLVEGYSPSDKEEMIEDKEAVTGAANDDAQLVITIDRVPASSVGTIGSLSKPTQNINNVTIARVVVNFLSVNAQIRPFKELLSFFAMTWPGPHTKLPNVEVDGRSDHSSTCTGDEPRTKQLTTKRTGSSASCLQLKFVAHYPRVFFVADESDPHSRALVLRGLAVINAGRTTTKEEFDDPSFGPGRQDTQDDLAIDAQLHALESYINADVYDALSLQQRHADLLGTASVSPFSLLPVGGETATSTLRGGTLGVALLQPVTIGIEFGRKCRSRFPSKRSLSVSIDPISTMLSFEDIQLIESVLGRWSSARRDSTSQGMDEWQGKENLARELSHYDNVFADFEGAQDWTTYVVDFHSKQLGLGLRKDGDRVIIDEVRDTKYAGIIEIGDILVRIGGRQLQSTTLGMVVQQLAKETCPVRLTLIRPNKTSTPTVIEASSLRPSSELAVGVEFSKRNQSSRFALKLKKDIPHGLSMEKSTIGDLPVVTSVDSVLARAITDTKGGQFIAAPQTGALLIEVNGESTLGMGFTKAVEFVDEVSRSTPGGDSSEPTYTLVFVETDSSVLGNHDNFTAAVSGAVLTFIDDLNGRDMPLLRGTLEAVEFRIERGMGINTTLLDDTELSPIIMQGKGGEINTESAGTVTVAAVAKTTIEYFHPKISAYEPLLEPSQICVIFERRNADKAGRPGQLGLELSDRLLREPPLDSPPDKEVKPQVLCLNFSDACADVLGKALVEWRMWRDNLKMQSEVYSSSFQQFHGEDRSISKSTYTSQAQEPTVSGLVVYDGVESLHGEHYMTQHGTAARNAAQAALSFAQKRGAESGAKGESSKPFIFRNRTGVSIAFVRQKQGEALSQDKGSRKKMSLLSLVGEYEGLENYDPEDVTELADGEDAKFHMDILSKKESLTKDAAKRVRNYEGQFPFLTVAIQAIAGVSVGAMTDLQVYKAGSLIRQLSVNKSEAEVEKHNEGGVNLVSRYSVPVVWKVEVEDNRRILTLSSAVRIVSLGCTSGIEVGFQRSAALEAHGSFSSYTVQTFDGPECTEIFVDDSAPEHPKYVTHRGTSPNPHSPSIVESKAVKRSPIQDIGIAQPQNPFYLPLWLALKLEPVTIYVRPIIGGQIQYSWGQKSVLVFGPSGEGSSNSTTDWVWQDTFGEALGSIRCNAADHHGPAAFLSCYASGMQSQEEEGVAQKLKPKGVRGPYRRPVLTEVLSVSVDSGITLRNLLPITIEWEAGHGMGLGAPLSVDGSRLRWSNSRQISGLEAFQSENAALKSGDCADVYGCNFKVESLLARFRLLHQDTWSAWASISSALKKYDSDDDSVLDNDKTDEAALPEVRQINVQVDDDFGVPITFGVRIVPKIAKASGTGRNVNYGVDVIVFAELWFGNLTSLPLTFGCPGSQIHAEVNSNKYKEPADAHVATKYSAEAALMEIASVLELGEKGTGMDTRTADAAATAGEIYNIPHQESGHTVEEIFEFLETKDSTVKRRWWATESYWNLRKSQILDLTDHKKFWHWRDECWKIDCSGQISEMTDGWESCKDLLGSGEGPFSGYRSFHPGHPFRRRRWFRSRTANCFDLDENGRPRGEETLVRGLQAFHHPILDSFSMAKRELKQKKKRKKQMKGEEAQKYTGDLDASGFGSRKRIENDSFKIAVKCGDGRWSTPVAVSARGACHGIVKVFASRWLNLTRTQSKSAGFHPASQINGKEAAGEESGVPYSYGTAPLSPTLYELVYHVSEVEGEWGELSRLMLVSARFSIRNDSAKVTFELKQAGTRDGTAVKLLPGEIAPFYWSDFRLPQLACIRPVVKKDNSGDIYKWSGGFDVCRLGMASLMVRQNVDEDEHFGSEDPVRTIRTLVEIRPGTGGAGINLSFSEESPDGDGALFRIENTSTFSIWLGQDGVLANPSAATPQGFSVSDGDMIRPGEQISWGLDVPYRQGKYARRKAATMPELLRVRIALAPLSSHAGIETTKVIGLSIVGESVRLKPAKLITALSAMERKALERVRVLAVTTADGPSRVLKFRLMVIPEVDNVLSSAFMDSVSYGTVSDPLLPGSHRNESKRAAALTEELLSANQLPSEGEAKREALFGNHHASAGDVECTYRSNPSDELYSVRVVFSGFLISLVDSSPSEICTIAINNVNAMAKWNLLRTSDASFLMSIGGLQMDNHCPSAPFPVVLCPDEKKTDTQYEGNAESVKPETSPLVVIGIEFAPSHSSGIVCLKSVTIAPRNLAISLDLALLVRLQRYVLGMQMHLQQRKSWTGDEFRTVQSNQKRAVPLPDIEKRIRDVHDAAATGVGRQQIYFGALAILPYTIKLSVAPARALTAAQAAFEGAEAAAIHQAVRKGDLRLGGSSSLLGVNVGGKNTTALAVVRGVVKSIVVDALLRLDGASLNFAGAFLRNEIFYGPQLATYLGAHYMQSLRQNVPALLGSLAFFGNPLGLVRGLGEGVSDFVTEPMKGMKKSFQRLDPSHMVDGVARGTGSLARHTVGGFAASSALLTSTFSKNMAVLTLDRRYAQRRDRGNSLRDEQGRDFYLLDGVESGFVKLAQGFLEGVTGVVRAPMRGAERSGFEGFAKGIGKGLLGLVVKPMIGLSDAATDVMIGVRSSVEGGEGNHGVSRHPVRPRRAMYGRDRVMRVYSLADAAACTLMLRTRIGGQSYVSHLDMDDRVALLSEKRLLVLDSDGKELLLVKFKHIATVEIREVEAGTWGVLIMLNTPRENGSELEVITTKTQGQAQELSNQIKHGMNLVQAEM